MQRKKVGRSYVPISSSLLVDFTLELWNVFHNELDLDRNGHLDASEWSTAFPNAVDHTLHPL